MKTVRRSVRPSRATVAWPRSLALVIALATVSPCLATEVSGRGDVGRGTEVFSRNCAVCHSVIAGLHKVGPSLAGVFGRQAGAVPFFTNYRALRDLDVVWDEQSLDAWLADPQGFTGRPSAMTVKLAEPQARADVIAYLKTLN